MDIAKKARPFLKWAGGKTRLLPELRKRIPESYGTYFEPFLGGGSLFFDLAPERSVLSDVNPELVKTYTAVRDDIEKLIQLLKIHAHDHSRFGASYYSQIRSLDPSIMPDADRAARMIYLNKTCFNGLWRVNKAGRFNTPMGKFKTPPTICDEVNLRRCSLALRRSKIVKKDYQVIVSSAKSSDLVYFDPPYVPVSTTANFSAYAKEGFGPADQKKLAALAMELKLRGVSVLLSNSGTETVAALYKSFAVKVVKMRRNINCSGDSRGEVNEYLIA
jgi:DNA adenine methylase